MVSGGSCGLLGGRRVKSLPKLAAVAVGNFAVTCFVAVFFAVVLVLGDGPFFALAGAFFGVFSDVLGVAFFAGVFFAVVFLAAGFLAVVFFVVFAMINLFLCRVLSEDSERRLLSNAANGGAVSLFFLATTMAAVTNI
jgi:hypothetical protein